MKHKGHSAAGPAGEQDEGRRRSSRGSTLRAHRACAAGAALVTVLGGMLAISPTPAGASSPGVTSSTISVGVPYVNFVALHSLGVTINEGSFPDAYTAIADYINAHGGVDGRKLVVSYAEMDPAIATDQTASCSQLTEDDHIFISLSPVYPDCYQQNHHTLVIAGSLPGTLPASAAADFSLSPPDAAFDPYLLATLNKDGTFKGKKVAIFYGATSDKPEVDTVQSVLKKLHVDLVDTALDSAVSTDVVASDQDTESIAQRFQADGVKVVIGVGGSGSTTWPRALLDNQSTYKPQYIATSESSLLSYVESAKGGNPYLDGVLAGSPTPTNYQEWQDPAVQKCAAEVKKAYPSDTINAPLNPTSPDAASVPATAVSVIQACQDLYMVVKIADAAGKNLTTASFTKAGESLKNVTFPGSGGPVSFAPGKPYALGTVNLVTYSPKSETLVPASASAAK